MAHDGKVAAIYPRRYHKARAIAGSAALAFGSLVAIPLTSSASTEAALHKPSSQGVPERDIIVLRAQCPEISRLSAGVSCPPQSALLSRLEAAHVPVLATTTLVDTITAELTAPEAEALSSSAAVAQVLPDKQLLPMGSPVSNRGPAGQLSPTAERPTSAARRPGSSSTYASNAKLTLKPHGVAPSSLLCGTATQPELDPQALQSVTANQARAAGIIGTGVKVAVITDGLHPTNPDFLRNAAYGPAGAHVITDYLDFVGQGLGAKTGGAEAFGDASSIAAQGNVAYNIAKYVNPAMASLLPRSGCWVKIVGTAPGASLMVLRAIGGDGTTTGVVLAIQYAVQHGAKVINESFGNNPIPDTGLDLVREADDAAVAAGVTVVVSSGDGGRTSTIGSPATDPNVISVGATTTLRAYAQTDLGGFYNPAAGNGHWVSNNVAPISSGGFDQAGGTVDLVAPGDLNWSDCSSNVKLYTDCAASFKGSAMAVQPFGGTSESAPLTAGAVADVIQAYSRSHNGASPSPALIKQVLLSTATDIDAPASEQGAGMLNIDGAVRLAESLPVQPTVTTTTSTTSATTTTALSSSGATTTSATTTGATTTTSSPSGPAPTSTTLTGSGTSSTATSSTATTTFTAKVPVPIKPGPLGSDFRPPSGAILTSPNQINVVAAPASTSSRSISVTNRSSALVTVNLSTRTLNKRVFDTGVRTFVMNPGNPTTNSGVFPIWSGVTEVYQAEKFTVPEGGSRLTFTAGYTHTNQTAFLHVALFEPDGAYAGYGDQEGLADFEAVEISGPPAGRWTAVFFTVQNGAVASNIGTSGTVQWDASVWDYGQGSHIAPSQLVLGPGETGTASISVTTPGTAGDSSESIVVSSAQGRTTIPLTMRAIVPIGPNGGTFAGTLSGGNGRAGVPAQINTYFFNVPKGRSDLDVSVALANDPNDVLVGALINPDGQQAAFSSNYTLVPSGSSFLPGGSFALAPGATPYLQLYQSAPEAGLWEVVLQWLNPVTGNELQEGFSGAIRFNQVLVASSGVPNSATKQLPKGHVTTATLYIANTGVAPEGYFLDPRLDQKVTMTLKNLMPGTSASRLRLPVSISQQFPLGVPLYLLPAGTSQVQATVTRLSGTSPIGFDMGSVTGDPDIGSTVPSSAVPGNSAVKSTGSAAKEGVALSEPQVAPGLWYVLPAEVGPWSGPPAPREYVGTKVSAVTRAFNTDIHSGSDDYWKVGFAFSRFYYVEPDQVAQVKIQIVPTSPVGTQVSGTLYIDDFLLTSFSATQFVLPNADQVAAVPYSYKVGTP